MSYAEKPEDITKEEWMDKLNNVHIQRADMNRLIMNYLVTGEALVWKFGTKQMHCVTFVLFLACVDTSLSRLVSPFQRDSKRRQKSFEWSLELSPAWTSTPWMKE